MKKKIIFIEDIQDILCEWEEDYDIDIKKEHYSNRVFTIRPHLKIESPKSNNGRVFLIKSDAEQMIDRLKRFKFYPYDVSFKFTYGKPFGSFTMTYKPNRLLKNSSTIKY